MHSIEISSSFFTILCRFGSYALQIVFKFVFFLQRYLSNSAQVHWAAEQYKNRKWHSSFHAKNSRFVTHICSTCELYKNKQKLWVFQILSASICCCQKDFSVCDFDLFNLWRFKAWCSSCSPLYLLLSLWLGRESVFSFVCSFIRSLARSRVYIWDLCRCHKMPTRKVHTFYLFDASNEKRKRKVWDEL